MKKEIMLLIIDYLKLMKKRCKKRNRNRERKIKKRMGALRQ